MQPIKYFGYVRKSTEGEEKQALSILAQKEKISDNFAGLRVVKIFEERQSAFEPYKRPIFQEMLDKIRAGEAQGIVAWHPDRLSRNEIDAGAVSYMIRQGQIKDLKFGSYNFDNSPEGIWMLQMALSQSQYFSAKLSKDVKRGNETKLRHGGLPGAAPEGYLNDRAEKVVIKDPVRFSLVRKMWDMMLTGLYTPAHIAKIANSEWGYMTVKRRKVGGRPLSRSAAYYMFNNLFYTGTIVRSGVEYEGNHEAMITLEEYDRVQDLLGRRGKPRNAPKREFAFRGLIFCGECGCQITASISKSHTYYYCTRRRKDYECQQRRTVREEELEKQIKNLLSGYTIMPEFEEWALDDLRQKNEIESEDTAAIYEMQHKAITKIDTQITKLIDMASRRLISEERFIEKNTRLEKQLKKLKKDLHDTEGRAEKWRKTAIKTYSFATHARQRFVKGELKTKKEVLMGLGENPILIDGKLKLEVNELLVPIGKSYSTLEKRFLKVKTAKNPNSKVLKRELVSIRSDWYPG